MVWLVRRLEKKWTKVLTAILVVEQITGCLHEEARDLLEQSEKDAGLLLARARQLADVAARQDGETT
jgi:hypothetical protein